MKTRICPINNGQPPESPRLNRGRGMLAAACLALSESAVPRANGTVIASDNFSGYSTPSDLDGKNGGVGWSGAWSGDTSSSDLISAGLSYGSVNGQSGALRINKNSGPVASRNLQTAYSGNSIYVSFLFSFSAGTINNGDSAYVFLNSSSGPSVGFVANASTDFFSEAKNGDGNRALAFNATAATTYHVVARFSKSSPGEGNLFDTTSLWVNPSTGDESNPLSTDSGAGQDSAISSLGFIADQLEEASDRPAFDNIIVGSAWTDVVPIPEPDATTLVLGAGGMFVVARGVRRWATKKAEPVNRFRHRVN